MKIITFGTASGISEKGKVHTCIGVESCGKMILLDIGEGASSSIAGSGVDMDKIEKIFISHTHADHSIGLPMFLQSLHMRRRRKKLEIYLPEKHIDAFKNFLTYLYIIQDRYEFEFKFYPLPSGEVEVFPNLWIKLVPTNHLRKYQKYSNTFGVETVSYAYLVREFTADGGMSSLFFSSDLDSIKDISGAFDQVDLLIIECSHIEIEDIIKLSVERGIGRIILTHILPGKDIDGVVWHARVKYGLDILIAYDGMCVEV